MNMQEILSTLTTSTDADALEIANAKAITDNRDGIRANLRAKCESIFSLEASLEDQTQALIVEVLDSFYATLDDTILNDGVNTVLDKCKKVSNSDRRTKLTAAFNTGILNGLGRLVNADRKNANGDALYAHDDNMTCAKKDKGQYVLISKNRARKVRERYVNELRALNLARPRMYYPEKDSIDWLRFLNEAAQSLPKRLRMDEDATARFNAMIDNQKAILAAAARKAVAEYASGKVAAN